METLSDRKYAKTDEWVKVQANSGRIGISDYAQDQLSDIVYVEFIKEPGDPVEKGEVFATIESVKAAADVNSPVSGIVKELNEALMDTPEVLNNDPYEEGWLGLIELSNESEIGDLMEAEDYESYCESR